MTWDRADILRSLLAHDRHTLSYAFSYACYLLGNGLINIVKRSIKKVKEGHKIWTKQ